MASLPPPRRDFLFDVSIGRIEGYEPAFVIGVQPEIGSREHFTVWDHPSRVQFLDAAEDIWVESSSPDDTGKAVLVSGYDANFNRKGSTVVLQEQPVNAGPFLLVQSAICLAQVNAGDVYFQAGSNLQSRIRPGIGSTRNGFMMVPAGKVAANVAIRGTTLRRDRPVRINTHLRIGPSGPLISPVSYTVAHGVPKFDFPIPVAGIAQNSSFLPILPAGSIIEFTGEAVVNGSQVFFGADFVLFPEGDFGIQEA